MPALPEAVRPAFVPQVPDDIQLLPDDYVRPLDLTRAFDGLQGPLHVDAGCGDGGFLLEMARRHPEARFLGIERLLGRVRKICRAACREGLGNVRVLRLETAYTVGYLLPPGSIRCLYVLFPDPWPKVRHHARRLLDAEFLEAALRALEPGGQLRIKTDHAGYADAVGELLDAAHGWVVRPWSEPTGGVPVVTDFEREFEREGRPVFRFLLEKPAV